MIELKEKQIVNGEIHLIAEYNVYDGDKVVQQLSRSPFVYPDTMTDEEIIADIQANYYYIYG